MLHRLDDNTLVGGQIWPEDIPAIAALGVTTIVNNRPDGEEPGQPMNAAIEAAAQAAGLEYRFIPVAGGFPPEQVAAMAAAVNDAAGKLLAFCRSGARSAHLWALATGKEISRA
jgi:uncharacterized protein (TIGR01244 family)